MIVMNFKSMKKRFLICVLAPLALAGCTCVQEPMRAFYRQMDPKLTNIVVADTYQKELPSYLGFAPEKVRVQLTAEAFDLTVYDVLTKREQQKISSEIASVNVQNPHLLPLRLQFQ